MQLTYRYRIKDKHARRLNAQACCRCHEGGTLAEKMEDAGTGFTVELVHDS